MLNRALVCLFAFTGYAAAQSAPPAPPQVTVGAELKQLIFDWDRVATADYYQLLYKPDAPSAFAPVGDPIIAPRSRARVNIAVHEQNWPESRYKVSACNVIGCQDSAELSVNDLMLDTIGYFKASNTDPGNVDGDAFARGVALSLDGRTLVVGAANEQSGATGVNGDQSDNSVTRAGAAYVFRRVDGAWRQEAYLKGDPVNEGQFFSYGYPVDFRAVAVSADGNLVAIGAPGETLNGVSFIGAVYVFGRSSDGTWTLAQKLQLPDAVSGDFFGSAVDLSGDGNTMRVLGLRNRDGEGNAQGEHHIYVRANGTYVYQALVTIPHNEVDFCSGARLSGDGQTVVQTCYSYGPEGGRIVTWKRDGATWTKLPTTVPVASAMQDLSLSHGAQRLAFRESLNGGFNSIVRVLRWSGSSWVLDDVIDTPPGIGTAAGTFGHAIAFDRNGTTLAVGDSHSTAGGLGVSNEAQEGGVRGGAVFVYERTPDPVNRWVLRKQVKAPNAEDGDDFGLTMSLSGNGRTLAVGAVSESSAATGIDGNQQDNSAPRAGAVYLY
jgi:hypothetical protein